MSFDDFFRAATAGHAPYDYQRRLACGERHDPEAEWLAGGTDCRSQLINIPTGLGKTAAVVLAWLWNRLGPSLNSQPSTSNPPQWPRRLVYCLPMRTLVDQTRDNVAKWLECLDAKASELGIVGTALEDLKWLADHSPVILMGGEEMLQAQREWDLHPERPCILIGTQDMLLSRALNRGYGMSRYRWPMHFGLLNNDCLCVMDETQLMGVGVETSAQLDGFRHGGKMPTFGACPTWWMSATLDAARFVTVDHLNPVAALELSASERAVGRPRELFEAAKAVAPCPLALSAATKDDYAKHLATLIHERHLALIQKPHPSGTLTLVILNRVSRAREVYHALVGGKKPLCDPAKVKVALIHSRFRQPDRQRHEELLFGDGDRIVIATQAVEAGVDVSARLLITELAPWSSLVQRIGRCNRRAEPSGGEVLWVDIEPDAKGELVLPYQGDELVKARQALGELTDASPRALKNVAVQETPVVRPVIRRRDLVDLFDTTPDICGQDLDVSRYIRDGDDNDVQLFWRNLAGDAPTRDDKPPQRLELCRVSIGDAAKFFAKNPKSIWRWNPLEKNWESAGKPRPGGVYLVATTSGGYHDALGWTGDPKDKPTPRPPTDGANETNDGDPDTFTRSWQTIAEHTGLVVETTDALTTALALDDQHKATLHTAALWHDVGKAHKEIQKMLRQGEPPPDDSALYAKSKNRPRPSNAARTYRSVRHELASALAWLLAASSDAGERDLVAYLIAAHHGKVRLSIRSLPDETGDETNPDGLFARGIWDGDTLPAVCLGAITTPETTLDLSFMKMGESEHGPSWLARTVALRDRTDLGPFRLAYLETLLRAADARASQLEIMPVPGYPAAHDLAGQHPAMAGASGGAQAPDSVGSDPARRGREHGLRAGTGAAGEDSRDTRPDRATRYLETARGILSYSELAPLLAERVAAVEASIFKGDFSAHNLDETLLLELHRRLAGDLVPEWAGRWRDVAVTVGRLTPPPPFQIPLLMRQYALDLQARWPAAAAGASDLLLELLAFTEGRFLAIHPFRDFNGRTIRVFLLELHRRMDLPRVALAPQTAAGRAEYFTALEAADRRDWQPLVAIWQQRLAEATSR
jgi:CRISPR-associated endonuclease/helicase Cas3